MKICVYAHKYGHQQLDCWVFWTFGWHSKSTVDALLSFFLLSSLLYNKRVWKTTLEQVNRMETLIAVLGFSVVLFGAAHTLICMCEHCEHTLKCVYTTCGSLPYLPPVESETTALTSRHWLILAVPATGGAGILGLPVCPVQTCPPPPPKPPNPRFLFFFNCRWKVSLPQRPQPSGQSILSSSHIQ